MCWHLNLPFQEREMRRASAHKTQHPDTFLIASNQLSAARGKIAIIEKDPSEN